MAFRLHTKSAHLLYKWFDNPGDRDRAKRLLARPGTQIMAEIVRRTLRRKELPGFADQLRGFSPDRKPRTDPFGIHLAWQHRKRSALILSRIESGDFSRQAVGRIAGYIPTDYPLNATCDVYFVLTGWKWGDAMVRRVKKAGGRYKIADDGEPVIIVNLSIMANLYFSKGMEKMLDYISHTMTHEGFHFAFAKYRDISPRWKKSRPRTALESLIWLIQDEGIAHYISHGQNQKLQAQYNRSAKLKERERSAFGRLRTAVKQLSDPDLDRAQKRKILMRANAGKYWSKFGSISGMFMVYHIERVRGRRAIRQSIAQGALAFLSLYDQVQKGNPDLPSLPSELKKALAAAQ